MTEGYKVKIFTRSFDLRLYSRARGLWEGIDCDAVVRLTDKSADTIVKDIEEAYDYLKNTCKVKASSDAVQGISEVLAISYGDTKD